MELKDLKKEYGKLEKKHKLPSFKEVNETFEIDKIENESDCLVREVRKIIMDKIINTTTNLMCQRHLLWGEKANHKSQNNQITNQIQ